MKTDMNVGIFQRSTSQRVQSWLSIEEEPDRVAPRRRSEIRMRGRSCRFLAFEVDHLCDWLGKPSQKRSLRLRRRFRGFLLDSLQPGHCHTIGGREQLTQILDELDVREHATLTPRHVPAELFAVDKFDRKLQHHVLLVLLQDVPIFQDAEPLRECRLRIHIVVEVHRHVVQVTVETAGLQVLRNKSPAPSGLRRSGPAASEALLAHPVEPSSPPSDDAEKRIIKVMKDYQT